MVGVLASWARALGGEVVGRQILCPGPGHSPRDRSLSVMQSVNAPGGFTVHSHAGDGFRLCRDHVARLVGLPLFEPNRRAATYPIRREATGQIGQLENSNAEIATKLWRLSQPIDATVGDRYLREVRGIRCALPPTMRFLPARGEYPDTILTAFGLPSEPEPGAMSVDTMKVCATHRTRLTPEGQKIGKAFLGSPAGLPLVMAPWTDSLGLVVAEGIEDALTAHQATGLAAWAAGSAGHLPKIADAIPDWCDVVTLLVDNNAAGHDGANKLANLLNLRSIAVELREASSMTGNRS